MFFLLGVSYLPILLPFSLIFGILFGHGKLSSQSEFTALASFGLSKLQMAQPAFLFTALSLFTCFQSIHSWGPKSKYQSRALKYVIKQEVAAKAFQPGVFLTQIPGVTMYAESQSSDKKLSRIFILNENNQDHLQIFSKNGFFTSKESSESNFGLKLLDGEIYKNSDSELSSLVISFRSYLVELFKTKQTKTLAKRQISNSTTSQLKQSLKNKTPKEQNLILIEINKRNMFSFSCLFFLIVGLIFSLRLHNRSSKGSGFFLAVLISLFFWIVLFVAEFLAKSQSNPLLVYSPVIPCGLFCLGSYSWMRLKSIN